MTDSQLKQDLRAVRALFSGPEKWTKGAYARDSMGNVCDSWSQDSVCWCISGAPNALLRYDEIIYSRIESCLDAIKRQLSVPCLIAWNDSKARKFEDIPALLDKAIEAAP